MTPAYLDIVINVSESIINSGTHTISSFENSYYSTMSSDLA